MVVLAFQHYFAYVAAMCVLLYLQNTHKPKRLIRYIRHWADFFVYFAKKILLTRIVDVCDRRVPPGQNFVPLYLSSKKPQQKIGEPSELANFLSGDDIARLCLVSQNSFTPSILH